jgi:hypothetical protein
VTLRANRAKAPRVLSEPGTCWYRPDKGVITDRRGNVVAWLNSVEPWYRYWPKWAYWTVKAKLARAESAEGSEE